jgi:hypothetical protein
MAGDVRRSGGKWRATGGAPAGVLAPSGTVQFPRAPSGTVQLQRSDRRSLWRLGMRARRGYGTYGSVPTWPRATSLQSMLRHSKAFSIR